MIKKPTPKKSTRLGAATLSQRGGSTTSPRLSLTRRWQARYTYFRVPLDPSRLLFVSHRYEFTYRGSRSLSLYDPPSNDPALVTKSRVRWIYRYGLRGDQQSPRQAQTGHQEPSGVLVGRRGWKVAARWVEFGFFFFLLHFFKLKSGFE